MLPTIATGNVASATAAVYEVANSCRFDEGSADTQLKRTNGSPTNAYKGTFSAWIKRSAIEDTRLFQNMVDGSNYGWLAFNSSHQLEVVCTVSGSAYCDYKTNRLFRDVSAWYHIMVEMDTTEVTATNRMKFYVNGVQETSFATQTFSGSQSSNHPLLIASTTNFHAIGASEANTLNLSGYMAEVVLLDGQALTPTSFGEFDSNSPTIWKPIDVSELTFGNNGYYLDFEDSDNLGDDESGNTNDFTEVNLAATDQATDTPTNNFATLNPLHSIGAQSELSQGNLEYDPTGHHRIISTIAPTSGKWYAEVKGIDNPDKFNAGVCHYPIPANGSISSFAFGHGINGDVGRWINDFGVKANGDYGTNNSWSSYMATLEGENNNIVGIYMDLDNYKIYLSKNGSLVSATGKNLTNNSEPYGFISVGEAATFQWNFGQPSFALADTAITDDNGYGAFEYSPNITGDSEAKKFYALCTKNLAEFG